MSLLNPEQLQAQFDALIANLAPNQRRKLAQSIGRELAKSQRQRIKSQQNPDGSAFEPRKRPKVGGKKANKKGRIKKNLMFRKLGGSLLRNRSNANQATVGYQSSNAVIARVHQYGLNSRVRKERDYKVKYAQRELLGFTDKDLEMVERLVIEQLGL